MLDEGGPGTPVRILLTSRQHDLIDVLQRKEASLARIYYGGLVVLHDTSNPEHIPLAAHAFRELMEKMPGWLDVPMKAHSQSLGSEAKNLACAWSRTVVTSACRNRDGWEGEIDQPLRGFLGKAGGFFAWLTKHRPSRKEEVRRFIRKLDPAGTPMAAPLEDNIVERWQNTREFFTGVCHHRIECESTALRERLELMETLIIERLKPTAAEDAAEIDQLLEEADAQTTS